MSQLICHFSPKGGVDDRMSKGLKEMTKESIATLRNLYDMDHPGKPLLLIPEGADETKMFTGEEILKAAQTLMLYRNTQAKRHLDQLRNSTKHVASTFRKLYNVEGWNESTRRNRINMIAAEFTNEVSRREKIAREQGVRVTREQIVNGYKSQGKVHDGQFDIFETIFNKLLLNFSNARKLVAAISNISEEKKASLNAAQRAEIARAEKIVQEYPKIFQNWAALCTFARMSLRDIESLKLGQTLEYAAETSPDNFSMDSPVEDLIDMEESTLEAWQRIQEMTSSFSSMGAEVRRFLSTVTAVDEHGKPMRDDLGYLIKMDPISTHQYLADIFRGVTTESGILKKMYSMSKTDPVVGPVFKALAKAAGVTLTRMENGEEIFNPISDTNVPSYPVIITQLLEDMHKNFVPYRALVKNRLGNIVSKLLNNQSNPLIDEFTLRLFNGKAVGGGLSLYTMDDILNEGLPGTVVVDWERVARWNNFVNRLVPNTKKEKDDNNVFSGLTEYANTAPGGFFEKGTTVAQRVQNMLDMARPLGIPLTAEVAKKIYGNSEMLSAFLKAIKEFRFESKNVHGSEVARHLKTLEEYAAKTEHTEQEKERYKEALDALNAKKMSYDDFISKSQGKNSESSIGSGKERIHKILGMIAQMDRNLKSERRVSWYDRKGKSTPRYSDRTPSYMGDMIDKIKEFVHNQDGKGLRDFIMNKWGGSTYFYNKETGKFYNKWLQELYDSIAPDGSVDRNALANVFQFEQFLGSDIDKVVNIFENFTEKQHAEAMIKHFIQPIDQAKGKSSLAKYPCFILGDSGVQMFFTAKRYDTDIILQGMRDVFQQEIERIKYVEATNKALKAQGFDGIVNFSETANEFTMLKFLNKDFADGKYWNILTGNKYTAEKIKALSAEEAMRIAKEAKGTDALNDAILQYMEDALADFKHKLAEVGVLIETKNSETGIKTYADKNGYFTQNVQWFNNSLDNMLESFFWNTKYATIQQLQMFTVDPAFYDYRYPVKDLQKRYKEIYAPGKGISTEARDYNGRLFAKRNHENVVYFKDLSSNAAIANPYFMKMIEKTFGKDSWVANKYKKNTLTDGQAYRTLESYRAVKGMAGEWSLAMEEAYNQIQAIRAKGQEHLTENDIQELAKLAVVFQPIKPYLYTLEKYKISEDGQPDDYALIPVQHKYAEIVLIPELMQEGTLRDMAKWMEANDVDMVASDKCVKVGAFGVTDISQATTTQEVNDALSKGLVHELSWSDYRIQTGVPEHLSQAQLYGTQPRKLILGNIDKSKNYDYLQKIFNIKTDDPNGPTVNLPGIGKVHLSGRNLISLYNSLVMGNLFDSYEEFASEISTNQKISDKMIQNIISNANQSEDNAFGLSIYDEGDLAGQFVIPPGEPGMEHDAAALLISLFKKAVNKQRILGGSAVQASVMGLSGWEKEGNLFEVVDPSNEGNVLYDEIEMPWNRTFTSATGKKVALNFNDWCNPDGTLKVVDANGKSKIVYGEDAKEYMSWPVSGRDKYGRPKAENLDENGYDKQGYYVPLIEQKYPGILDTIAYRIPTERDYSMLNCKVFRFTDPLAGGIMKVPASRTTTAGFDFDIDKLYFFMKEFAQTHLSEAEVGDIWAKIYGLKYDDEGKVIGGNEIYEALVRARNLDEKGSQLLGDFSEMFSKSAMLKSLSDDNQKNSIGKLHTYWEAAGLEGTAEEAFTKYLVEHNIAEYDTYNPEVSPLNPITDKKGKVIKAGNSRVARNNLLIDIFKHRLRDEETLKARYTPGGFEANRDAALRMRVLQFADKADITTDGKIDWKEVDKYVDRIHKGEIKDPEPEYDATDPTAILVYNQQNQVAAKLIGIFANQNTNHVYASTMESLRLAEPLYFGNHTEFGLSDFLKGPEGVDVDTNVAEYLAASVDAVKDPVLNFLNLNLITADAGALLARLGYTPQEIGLLFNQPIIKEVCDYANNQNVSTDAAISEILTRYAGRNAAMSKIEFDSKKVSTDALANNILQKRDFDAKEQPTSEEFKRGQLQVLWLFNELMADASDLNSFVQSTRFTAANSIGSTFGDQIAQEERVKDFIDKYVAEKNNSGVASQEAQKAKDKKRLTFQLFAEAEPMHPTVSNAEDANFGETKQGILNISEKLLNMTPEEYVTFMSRNPLAFEQCMMDLSRKAFHQLFSKHFPYYTELYGNVRTSLARLTKYGNLKADTINSIHRELMVYLLTKQLGSKFNGESYNEHSIGGMEFTNREYYTNIVPQLIQALKTEGALEKYPLFEMLTITGDKNNKSGKKQANENLRISVQGMGGLQARTSNLFTEAWAEAYRSNDMVHCETLDTDISIKDLAEGLYFHNFFRMGYNFHPTVFMNLTPTFLKLGLNINDETDYLGFIRDVIAGKKSLDALGGNQFTKQYLLNHLDNKEFVYYPSGNARRAVSHAWDSEAGGWRNSFSLSYKSLDESVRGLYTIKDKLIKQGLVAFKPVIAITQGNQTAYYMAESNHPGGFNVVDTANGIITYRKVYAQGSKGDHIQYFDSNNFEKFQREAGVVERAKESQQQQQQNPSESQTGTENQETGTPEGVPEGGHLDTQAASAFTDAEWDIIANRFRELFPTMIGEGVTNWIIRSMLENEEADTQTRDLLKGIVDSLRKEGKLKTIDKDGNPINVCM